MKKRWLGILLALCLLVCFAPAAFAAEGDAVPQVANMSIAYNGTDIVKENANGSLVFTATGNTQVVDYTATVTLSDGAVFTPTTPTALPEFLRGSAGGVVGKNVRGAFTEFCWATMKVVGTKGTGTEAAGNDICAFDNVSESTTIRDFTLAGLTQNCWVRAAGTATDFNTSVVTYPFTVAN